MKEGEQQEWQAAGRDADTTGVLISPAPRQRKCAHLRFTVPLFFCRSQRSEKERGRDEKRKQNKTKTHKKHTVWAWWQAGSRRKCWIGRAVRCVWEWEGWGLPTQRPVAQQHRNPAETGQGEADVPLTQRVKAGRRGGGGGGQMRLGGGTSSFCSWNGWVSWGWRLQTDTRSCCQGKRFCLREKVL